MRAFFSRHWELGLAAALFVASVYSAVDHILNGAYGIAGYLLLCALGLLWACSGFIESAAFERLKEQGAARDVEGQ